jgi:hypothetical protein
VTFWQRYSADSGACNQRKRANVRVFRRRTHEADRNLCLQEKQRTMSKAHMSTFVLCLALCSEIGHVTPRRGSVAVLRAGSLFQSRARNPHGRARSTRQSSTLIRCGLGCPRPRHSCSVSNRSIAMAGTLKCCPFSITSVHSSVVSILLSDFCTAS